MLRFLGTQRDKKPMKKLLPELKNTCMSDTGKQQVERERTACEERQNSARNET